MYKKHNADKARQRRHLRVRKRLAGTTARPRLSVYRSAKGIYAQLIDDSTGQTLLAVSTLSKDFASRSKGTTKLKGDEVADAIKGLTTNSGVVKAWLVGQAIAEAAKAKGITHIVFDRGGYLYHGRVAAVAEGARAGGLEF